MTSRVERRESIDGRLDVLDSMTDETALAQDIARCMAGDVVGLEAIYRAFGDRVFRLCRSVLGDDHEAEDATQEVFLRVFKKIATFEGRSKLSTWIYRLTVNQCLNLRRRLLRWPRLLGEDATLRVEDRAANGARTESQVEAREEVDRLLRSLPRPQRAVLALREIIGLEYAEIGQILNIPEGTVMSRLSRARSALAANLETKIAPSALPSESLP